MSITSQSLALFLSLANDAGNWSGTPMVDISKEEKGNLTQLKRAKLLTTMTEDGVTFAFFTEAGRALAAEHGIALAA